MARRTVTRPTSVVAARRAFDVGLIKLMEKGEQTKCFKRPIPYTSRQTPEEAEKLCEGCPLLELCKPLGFTESTYADDMVFGGIPWRKGKPVGTDIAPTKGSLYT